MVSGKQLGQNIKVARKNAGITQDELSDRAGLAYSTLAKIEQGAIKSPSFFTVYALAEALRLEIGELIGNQTQGDENGKTIAPNRSEKKIKFVYSDMNGVLVRFYHKAFVRISKETSCNLELVESTFWHYNDAVNKGDITMGEFNDAVAKHLGVKSVDWEAHYMTVVKPINAMQKYLEGIQSKVKIGMLTNTMPGFIQELKRRNLLPNIEFDVVIDSSVEGIIKPDLAIYKLAEKRSGFKASEILFIDDSRTNLITAEKLGWRVIWFDNYEPEESVRRLGEVIAG